MVVLILVAVMSTSFCRIAWAGRRRSGADQADMSSVLVPLGANAAIRKGNDGSRRSDRLSLYRVPRLASLGHGLGTHTDAV